MDWFEKLMGFRETSYEATQEQLELTGTRLRSQVNGRSYSIGTLELVSLKDLRQRAGAAADTTAKLTFSNIIGDVRALHQRASLDGALFQVASQFNMLEMVGPDVSPEQGVTRYQYDGTQGPACAIAAGAATIFRNYFAPVNGQPGQTRARQLDGLADLGTVLAEQLGKPVGSLWKMRNGYALCSEAALIAISNHLKGCSEAVRDELRCELRIGLHSDVEATEGDTPRMVTQAFCSALPVAYSDFRESLWQPFAELVLEAAYEATLLAAVVNAHRGRSNIVLLTQLGGGAFGNAAVWIEAAIKRALELARCHELDVRMVSYSSIPASMKALEYGRPK